MDSPTTVYAISMNWFRQWQQFIRTKSCDPPGPIDNTNIVLQGQQDIIKPGSDYAQISEEIWQFFHQIYGGGPEVKLRTSKIGSLPQRSQSVTAIPSSHFENLTITSADSVPEFFIPPLKPKKRVYDTNIEVDKDIAPVHEVKSMAEAEKHEPMEVNSISESVAVEITSSNASMISEVAEDKERSDFVDSTTKQRYQRQRKRAVKCKKSNKQESSDNKSLTAPDDK